MPRINVDSDYFDHPKTHRLKVYCGPEADIYPIRLWSFVGKYFPKDGILKGYSPTEIEAIVGWNGIAGSLISALERVGFVKKVFSEFQVNDWQEHAGFIWKYKRAGSRAGKKSAESKASKRNESQRIVNGLEKSVERIANGSPTMELNGIEWNKNVETGAASGQTTGEPASKSRFKRPTLEEVVAYCQERGNNVNAQKLFNHYEASGWKRGKTPISDWKACVRTWEEPEAPKTTRIAPTASELEKAGLL